MKTLIVSGGIIMLLFAGLIGFLIQPQPLGSVQQASEYHATTTASGISADDYVIFEGSGVLGSVIISSSSASTFTVLDADGDSTTTVATIVAAADEQTFTFDTNLYNGLILTIPASFDGQFITTYR